MSLSALLLLSPFSLFLQETSEALGTDGTGGAPSEESSGSLLVPMMLIMGIFYFVLIAPERKKQKKRDAMLGTMTKGERVMTTSGMYGTVVQIKDDVVTLQVADNVRLRFSKAAIQTLLDREEAKPKKGQKALPQGETHETPEALEEAEKQA